MNDTGGGVTAIHDVPGDITRIGFHWMLFFPFCHSKGGLFVLHTECRGDHGGSSCHEFANLRIFSSHGMSRRSRIFLSRICEFANFFLHMECRGIIFFITNYRIFLHTENHGDYGFSLSRDLSLDPLTAGR